MMKPVTGQYECAHQSGIGLDYFTSRFDRLTIYPNGRFLLIEQDHSRLTNAAQSLISGQQVSTAAPETRREGNYIVQGMTISFRFDDGKQEQGQIPPGGDGLQLASNTFTKVSDSTMLPPTHRMKKDMDDIAKGLKIAGTIGGMAFKAAKTVHETIQSVQAAGTSQQGNPGYPPQQGQPGRPPMPPQEQQGNPGYPPPQGGQSQQPYAPPAPNNYPPPQQQPAPAAYTPPSSVQPARPVVPPGPAGPRPVNPAPQPPMQQAPIQPPTQPAAPKSLETRYCDQCGAPARPGKRFCNQCGAELP